MEQEHFRIVRPIQLGLSQEEIEAAAAAAMEATRSAADGWNARYAPRTGIADVDIRVRAKAVDLNTEDRILPSPWRGSAPFFMALDTGEWRVAGGSLFEGLYDEEMRIAVGLGMRWMHWPRLQADHPGCWTFAADDRGQPAAACGAIREATAFADAAMLPDDALKEAIRIFKGDRRHVCATFRVGWPSVERRMRRLGIAGL